MTTEQIQLIDCDPGLKQIDPQTGKMILEVVVGAIETLMSESVDQAYNGERVLQLHRLERADNFYRGNQNIAPAMDPSTGSLGWTTVGPVTQPVDAERNARAFDYNPRLTKSYGDKFIAVLGQRPFYNCTAEGGDPNNENDRRGARQVNLLIQMLMGQINCRVLNLQLFFKLYKNGTVLGLVVPIRDGKRLGYHEVANLVPQQECLGCGGHPQDDSPTCPDCGGPTMTVPTPDPQNPTLKYPKTSVDLVLLDGYTTTWPFRVRFDPGQRLSSPWIVSKCERDRGEILRAFPQSRTIVGVGTNSPYSSGDASDATGATVRAEAYSQTGAIRSRPLDTWTDARVNLDVSRLEMIQNDHARGLAKQAFPDGVYLVQVENKTVAIRNEDYSKKFSACIPSMSDFLFTDGGCWGMLGLEDLYSNMLNIMAETLETGVMRFITNPEYVDADALNRSRYSPNRFTEAIAKYGDTLANAITPIPTSDYPEQMPQAFELVDTIIQNILGLLPQVYGQMPGGLTLGQARMMLNQGLMQLGTLAELATSFWEQSWTNAVNMYCEVAGTNPTYQGETVDLELIKSSDWTIRGDTAIPRTFAERVENLRDILMQSPQLATALKLDNPVNASRMREYFDLPDMEDPDADAMEALGELIDQLWQGEPIQPPPPQPQPDPVTGMIDPNAPAPPPAPPQPSIPYDGLVFDPMMTMQLARASLLKSMLKPTPQRNQQSAGFQNVRAFLMAAQQAATPPPEKIPIKINVTGKIPDVTPEQEGTLFNDAGVTVPPPHPGAVQARAMQGMAQGPQGAPPAGGGSPPQPGPPNLAGGPPLMEPGAPAMNGAIQ